MRLLLSFIATALLWAAIVAVAYVIYLWPELLPIAFIVAVVIGTFGMMWSSMHKHFK